jgi:hypothetical protein
VLLAKTCAVVRRVIDIRIEALLSFHSVEVQDGVETGDLIA